MASLPNKRDYSIGNKSNALLDPVAFDVTSLMLYFLAGVQHGAPLSFDTYKTAWRKLRFSMVLTACPRRRTRHSYMQDLYSIPLEALHRGISEDTVAQVAKDNTCEAIEKLHGLTFRRLLEEDKFIGLCKQGSVQLTFAAICTLYCLYFTQQFTPKVRIHVDLNYQNALKEATAILCQSKNHEGIGLLHSLLAASSLIPGTLSRELSTDCYPPSYSHRLNEPKETQASNKDETNAAREVRYHVNSTLLGLGSGHLESLCTRYKRHLENLWSAFNPHGEPAPEGVAELSLGLWVHKYVGEKSKEVEGILNHGKRRRKAVLCLNREKESIAKDAVQLNAGQTAIPNVGISRKRPASKSRKGSTSKEKEEMTRDRDKISRALGGMSAISDRLTAREKARRKDMFRRAKPWTKQLGISDLLTFSHSSNVIEQEDMPVIPHLT